jgi:hypothetical protein
MITPTAEFIRCACEHCAGEFEIPPAYIGRRHECPHCHRETVIAAMQQPPLPPAPAPKPPLAPQQKPRKIEKPKDWGWWSLVSAIGYLIAIPPFLVILIIIIGALSSSEPAPNAAFGIGFVLLIPAVLGAAIVSIGAASGRRIVCSECGNRVTDRGAKVCAVCNAHFD